MPYLETLFWKLAIRIIKRRYVMPSEIAVKFYLDSDERRVVEWIKLHIKRINKNHNETN
jgi:hypothetical protein